jgi:hypothetical protein
VGADGVWECGEKDFCILVGRFSVSPFDIFLFCAIFVHLNIIHEKRGYNEENIFNALYGIGCHCRTCTKTV